MVYDEPPDHAQKFEQAIATAFACRNIIKYNSTLSDEQKDEMLGELDATLQFLRDRLVANATIEATTFIPPLNLAGIFAPGVGDDEDAQDDGEDEMVDAQSLSEAMLRNLYKLYHAYFNTQPGKGINALETRYKIALEVLDDVQAIVRQQQDTSAGENAEQLLNRIRAFITTLYCMFHEFAAVLANILEGKNISADTEELSSLQKYAAEKMQKYMLRDISPLMRVYGAHLQFQQRKGSVANLVSDATAFLIFLEELPGRGFPRQQEIVKQMKVVAELLHDLSSLLSDYEQALSTVLTL